MTRLEKLETLVKIEEGIQSFKKRIEISEDIIDYEGLYFRELRDIHTNKKDTYQRCIARLNERFRKLVLKLK